MPGDDELFPENGMTTCSKDYAAVLLFPENTIVRLATWDIERFTSRFETPHSL